MLKEERQFDCRFNDATDISDWRLCIGCGACVSACPENRLEMVDVLDDGLRPILKPSDNASGCDQCTVCVSACPGIDISHSTDSDNLPKIQQLAKSWGPILEVWEGHATDHGVHFEGSSGGLASALAVYCIEKGGMHGVAHVGNDPEVGYRNKSVFSRTRAEILQGIGSRYAPASPCDNLQSIAEQSGPSAFVGKPCDVEGLRKVAHIRPDVARNVGVAIGIFCAGTPSTQGTIDLLSSFGIDYNEVEELKYRGRGWPGAFSVRLKGSSEWRDLTTYEKAWGFLEAYRPFRCHLCPDSTSEFADISCGDPWYRDIQEGETGSSLILVRSELGRQVLRGAIEQGYFELHRVDPDVLDQSQRELQFKRGAIWGRTLALRVLGIPAPRIRGFQLFSNWLGIPLQQKAKSIVGTFRRVIKRGYWKPIGKRPTLD